MNTPEQTALRMDEARMIFVSEQDYESDDHSDGLEEGFDGGWNAHAGHTRTERDALRQAAERLVKTIYNIGDDLDVTMIDYEIAALTEALGKEQT